MNASNNKIADHYEWLTSSAHQVYLLGLDEIRDHLQEMARNEKNALRSQIKRLITHLLKWKYQPDHQTRSWRISIDDARDEIEYILQQSPSLKKEVPVLALNSYRSARNWAATETEIETIPKELEFSPDQLLDQDFFP